MATLNIHIIFCLALIIALKNSNNSVVAKHMPTIRDASGNISRQPGIFVIHVRHWEWGACPGNMLVLSCWEWDAHACNIGVK